METEYFAICQQEDVNNFCFIRFFLKSTSNGTKNRMKIFRTLKKEDASEN